MTVSGDAGEERSGAELRELSEEERAFLHALYLEHYMALQSYAFRLGFRGDAVEDWLQETFLTAIRRIDVLRRAARPRAYLMQILRNVIGNTLRSMKYAARIAEALRRAEEREPEGYRDEPDPETLYRGLVSDGELHLLLRYYRDGLSQRELAEELGVDVGACNMRIQRARARLRTAMERDGLL